MSSDDKGRPAVEGYKPEAPQPLREGYQPTPGNVPATEKEQGGYQPTSKGDNPGNNPTPPGAE
jgi:hypothetical protein